MDKAWNLPDFGKQVYCDYLFMLLVSLNVGPYICISWTAQSSLHGNRKILGLLEEGYLIMVRETNGQTCGKRQSAEVRVMVKKREGVVY